MSYALVVDNQIMQEGRLPSAARRLDTREWVLGLPEADTFLQKQCGWHEVADAERPQDSDQFTFERALVLDVMGPRVTWLQRNWTADELQARKLAANARMISDRLAQARTVNKAFIDRGVANTAADVRNWTLAAARELNGIIMLLSEALDDIRDA
jgi:hypothetical protein